MKETASASVMFIFQFAAMIFLRIKRLFCREGVVLASAGVGS
jgi:hypothetical protein